MAFVRVSPPLLASTPADFARNLQATIAAFQRVKGRRPVAVPLRRAGVSGLLDYNPLSPTQNPFFANCNWWDVACWSGLDSVISGQLPQPSVGTSPPTLAPGSVSPGLPVGYSAATGTVSVDNTQGATVANPYTPIYPATSTGVSWSDPSSWTPGTWLIVGLGGVGLFLVLRRTRGRR